VHTAENALNSPSGVRTSRPGLEPNLKVVPEFGGSWEAFAATALAVAGSPVLGGIR
jgi:hypothetical protein